MKSWRTQLAIAVLTLSISPAGAQSLGDVARLERERRARMAHHAPMLTDEDLRRDQILKRTPIESDSALPSPDNSTSTNVDENLPLGDYARALRRRRIAEPAPPQNAVAAGPAPEPQPAAVAIVTHEPQPAAAPVAADQKATSLGDLAREVRAERAAARRIRLQQKNAAQQSLAQQKPAQPAAESPKKAIHAEKNTPVAVAAHAAPPAKVSPKPPQAKEIATKASAQQAIRSEKTSPAAMAAHAAPPVKAAPKPAESKEVATKAKPQPVHNAVSVTVSSKRAQSKEARAAEVTHAVNHVPAPALPAATSSVKPAQLTEVVARPRSQAPEPRVISDTGTAGEQSIRVPRGASLWKLARTYLGSGNLWTALWKANPQIHDPNRIRAGQKLRLPDLDDKDDPGSNGF